MAIIKSCSYMLINQKIKCIFCGKEINEGAMWPGNKEFFVGACCKNKLIQVYKDIILDVWNDIEVFEYEISYGILEVIQKEEENTVLRIIELEKRKKQLDKIKQKYNLLSHKKQSKDIPKKN